MQQLTDHDQKMLALYHERQAERLKQEQQLQAEKAERDAYWQEKRNPKPKTARSPHPCETCNGTIAKGEQYRKRTVSVNVSHSGWTQQFRTLYRHLECSIKEAKQNVV